MQAYGGARNTCEMEFKDRLKAARRHSKLTQIELATAVGISQTSITDLERGKSQSTSYVAEIAGACGVNPLWLATGKGEMVTGESEEASLRERLDMALSMYFSDDEAMQSLYGCTKSEALAWRNHGFMNDPRALKCIQMMPSPVSRIGAHSNVGEVLQPHKEAKEYPLISWVAAGCWEESCDNFNPGDADEWLKSDANAGAHGYWLEIKGPSMLPTFSPGMRILVKPENFDLTSGKYYVAKLLDTGETTFKQYLRDGGSSYLQPLNQAFPVIPVTENVAIIGMVVDAKLPASLF